MQEFGVVFSFGGVNKLEDEWAACYDAGAAREEVSWSVPSVWVLVVLAVD